MYIAKVVGNVVATKKNDTLMGSKLMIVQPVNSALKKEGPEEVAADFVGAGIGEYVLVGSGSSVSVEEEIRIATIELAIIGIIDDVVV